MCAEARNAWFWLKSGAASPAINMAVDETLLEAMPRLATPVLRFYSWTEPAASFGYFQKHADVEHLTPLRPLVRRPTAGGIVPHDRDWTYSVSIPVGADWYKYRAIESYASIHRWIQSAFNLLGLAVELAEHAVPSAGQCFAGYEQFDLLWQGKKIAGAAQRRNRSGLLIQGSVQPSALSIAREAWEDAMLRAGAERGAATWTVFSADDKFSERAETLAREKYSSSVWNLRR